MRSRERRRKPKAFHRIATRSIYRDDPLTCSFLRNDFSSVSLCQEERGLATSVVRTTRRHPLRYYILDLQILNCSKLTLSNRKLFKGCKQCHHENQRIASVFHPWWVPSVFIRNCLRKIFLKTLLFDSQRRVKKITDRAETTNNPAHFSRWSCLSERFSCPRFLKWGCKFTTNAVMIVFLSKDCKQFCCLKLTYWPSSLMCAVRWLIALCLGVDVCKNDCNQTVIFFARTYTKPGGGSGIPI